MKEDHSFNHSDWSPDELRGALEAEGVALWSWHVDTDAFLMDSHGYTLWDVSKKQPLTFEHLSDKIHRGTVTGYGRRLRPRGPW